MDDEEEAAAAARLTTSVTPGLEALPSLRLILLFGLQLLLRDDDDDNDDAVVVGPAATAAAAVVAVAADIVDDVKLAEAVEVVALINEFKCGSLLLAI